MTIAVTDIFSRAAILLQDPDHIRWPLPGLLGWINDCTADMSNEYQHATSITINISLEIGIRQVLPPGVTNLIEIICNVEMMDDGQGGMQPHRRGAITPISRTVLDQLAEDWQDPDQIAYGKTVDSIIDNPASPGTFLVFPGNNGEGMVEALVSMTPEQIPVPDSNDNDPSSYDGLSIDIDRKYTTAVVDFVVGRAFGSDVDVPNAFNRMDYYMQSYARRMGMTQLVDRETTPQESTTIEVNNSVKSATGGV